MLRGVILAAGRGARLNGLGHGSPKCLVRLGAVTLLERQVQALRDAGIEDIVVVVGCAADRVRRLVGGSVHYVENARYEQTNSLYSLWLARPLLLDGFVVLNCDVLFHPQLLTDLLTARCENAAVIAYRDDDSALGDEEMKVKVRRGRVIDFSKQMPADEADGENVGMLKFGRDGARLLSSHLDRLVANGGVRDWAPRGFAAFARDGVLCAIGTRGYPWIEIDFPEDYERARTHVLPVIEGASAGVRTPRRFEQQLPPPEQVASTPDDSWPLVLAADVPGDPPAVPSAK